MALKIPAAELLDRAKTQLLQMNQSTSATITELNAMDKMIPAADPIPPKHLMTTPVRKPAIRPYSCDKFSTQVKRQQLKSLQRRIDTQLNAFGKLSQLYMQAKSRQLIG